MNGHAITRIERSQAPSALRARAVVTNGIATTCFVAAESVPNLADQTRQVFAQIDHYLALGGASRSTLLTAQVWLRDIRDYGTFVEQWNEWVDRTSPPVLSIIGSQLGDDALLVEVKVTALVRPAD
jgi:enamine deaminase RidA (YjgF/YER057c/UK114 family)